MKKQMAKILTKQDIQRRLEETKEALEYFLKYVISSGSTRQAILAIRELQQLKAGKK
jgi:hypothetical protein